MPIAAGTLERPLCASENSWGVDWDSVLAYGTPKVALIRDKRLWALKWFFVTLVALYVAIYQLGYEGLYLEQHDAAGVVRFTLQAPTEASCSLLDFQDNCTAVFPPISRTSYCSQSPLDYGGQQYPCAFYDESDLGIFRDDSAVVGTRITEYRETRACSIENSPDSCPLVWALDGCDSLKDSDDPACVPSTYYATAVEQFTLLFDHHLSVSEFGVEEESADMIGMIRVGEEGDASLCKEFDGKSNRWGEGSHGATPCYIYPNTTSTGLDFISLDVLLRAGGVTLDTKGGAGQVYRNSGVSIIVSIHYTNRRHWKLPVDRPRYTYEVKIQEDSTYKYFRQVFNVNTTRRNVWNMHGVRVNTIQAGQLKRFSFNNLLIQLTTSLTLLTLATMVTEWAMLFVLPDREVYRREKFSFSEDMSDYRRRRAVEPDDAQLDSPLLASEPSPGERT